MSRGMGWESAGDGRRRVEVVPAVRGVPGAGVGGPDRVVRPAGQGWPRGRRCERQLVGQSRFGGIAVPGPPPDRSETAVRGEMVLAEAERSGEEGAVVAVTGEETVVGVPDPRQIATGECLLRGERSRRAGRDAE